MPAVWSRQRQGTPTPCRQAQAHADINTLSGRTTASFTLKALPGQGPVATAAGARPSPGAATFACKQAVECCAAPGHARLAASGDEPVPFVPQRQGSRGEPNADCTPCPGRSAWARNKDKPHGDRPGSNRFSRCAPRAERGIVVAAGRTAAGLARAGAIVAPRTASSLGGSSIYGRLRHLA